jgi:hypothetical protein
VCQRAAEANQTCRRRRKTLRVGATPARYFAAGCPALDAVCVLARGLVLVRERFRRASFCSGGSSMCAKGLRALLNLVVA